MNPVLHISLWEILFLAATKYENQLWLFFLTNESENMSYVMYHIKVDRLRLSPGSCIDAPHVGGTLYGSMENQHG